MIMSNMMKGAYLPGNSTVVLKDVEIPEPGHGHVLIRTKSSTICGSDIRAIYHQHLGKGPEGYQNKIAGHEPAGQIVKCGPGMRRFKEGDRVILYHISGCGLCTDCRRGYMISCTSPLRAAYGWQRDGGMAPYILADEKDCVPLPDGLTYTDGAQVACGFGTVYEGLERIGISGNDVVLVTGLGPVGLAALMLARAMGAQLLIGVDVTPERCRLALDKKLADHVFINSPEALEKIRELTGGRGVETCRRLFGTYFRPSACDQGNREMGPDRLHRRGRNGGVQPQSRYHPRSENHLRLMGNKHLEDGRADP
jgi:threonine dehydrogenase-like Zn-dependent dehydrogenase